MSLACTAFLKRRIRVAGMTLVVSLAGCVSSHVLVGTPRPPIQPSEVHVYLQPPAQYQQIALLQTSSRAAFAISAQAKTDKVVARLKQEAASLGANGIVLQGLGDQAGGAVELDSAQLSSSGRSALGVGSSVTAYNKSGSAVAIFVPAEGSKK
jgi:hypothetical protein